MRKLVVVMAFTFFSLFSCRGHGDLSVDEFEEALAGDPSAQLVDVRTPEEYAEGHLALSVNIDWFDKGFADKAISQLDKSGPVLVFAVCRHRL